MIIFSISSVSYFMRFTRPICPDRPVENDLSKPTCQTDLLILTCLDRPAYTDLSTPTCLHRLVQTDLSKPT